MTLLVKRSEPRASNQYSRLPPIDFKEIGPNR